MSQPTQKEIAKEVAALRALKPYGKFAEKTAETIATAIEALTEGIDTTAEEWDDLNSDAQQAAEEAMAWRDGMNRNKPSASFEGLAT